MTREIKEIFLLVLIGIFAFSDFAFAQSCPSMTTVSGTNVTFVGEVTDTGGDVSTTAWFEYGQTTAYGQKSPETVLTSAGVYCITVSSLSPCTTYHYRAVARNSAGTSYGEDKTFTTSCGGPSVDLKVNNSDGPITISYNTPVTLIWNSSNANYCTAFGGWSGTKPISGSETTGNLTSSKTYTLTCTGSGGSASDSVTVYVAETQLSFSVNKLVRNLSDGTVWQDSVSADPLEVISFSIQVTAGDQALSDVIVKDILPAKIGSPRNLKVDNNPFVGDITSGINIGNLIPNQTKRITFDADVLGPNEFGFGETQLTNTVNVSSGNLVQTDTAKIIVTKKAVAGAATGVPTGFTDNLLFDSLVLPLSIASVLTWVLKSHILAWEEWLDERKRRFQEYKSAKLLKLKIAKIKAKEFFRKR